MPSKPPEAYLFDMLEAARKIERFLEGYDLAQFRQDEKTISAVERQFILLGEAAKRVDPAFRARFPEINFRLASLMWNVVTHHYDQVDLDRLCLAELATESDAAASTPPPRSQPTVLKSIQAVRSPFGISRCK